MMSLTNLRSLYPRSFVLGAAFSLLALLPFSGLRAELPRDLSGIDARRVEVELATDTGTKWKKMTKEREDVVVAATPDFLTYHRKVQAVDLTNEERALLIEQGAAALAPEKAAVFLNAAAPMGIMKVKMADYFEAYDKWMATEIHARVLGAVAEVMQKRFQVEQLMSEKTASKVEHLMGELFERESKYLGYLTDPAAKNHHLSNSIGYVFDTVHAITPILDKHLRKAGLAPKVPWSKRFKAIGGKIKKYARLTKIGALCLPALGRMVAYLYNPFKKKADPVKVSNILRFLSKSYRWAAGMNVEVIGAEFIPQDQPVIFAFSHRSEIEDAVVMMGVLPKEYSFMVAQRAIPKFLNNKLVSEPNVINVGGWRNGDENLENPDNKVDAIAEGIKSIEEGRDLAIFPEGTTSSAQQETRPLRSGIDVVASATYEKPLSIVAVSIDDPSNDYDDPEHVSLEDEIKVTVTFSRPIDPLKLKSVPGAGKQLLLDTVRAFWHRGLYRSDVGLESLSGAPLGSGPVDRIEVPEYQTEQFEALYQE